MEKKTLLKNEWLSLMEADGWYTYSHETRCKGIIVSVLVYVTDGNGKIEKILGRYEKTPPHDDGLVLTSLTGGLEPDKTPKQTALQELSEEGGFDAEESDLEELGTVRPSKSADTTIYLYAFDATEVEDLRREVSIGDGSEGEKDAYCDWVATEKAIDCKCPLVSTMLMRLCQTFSLYLGER